MPLPDGDRATGYRAKRRAGEDVARGLLVAAGLALGGCGTGGILVGGDPGLFEPLATGSLAEARAPTLGLESPAFERASAALAQALDPLGPGEPVSWTDPDGGARGAVAAAAGPAVEGDLVCRRFRAESALRGGAPTRHVGHACRIAAGTWRIEAADLVPAAAGDAPPGGGLPADLMPDLPPDVAPELAPGSAV